jgi:hypothetical protein
MALSFYTLSKGSKGLKRLLITPRDTVWEIQARMSNRSLKASARASERKRKRR